MREIYSNRAQANCSDLEMSIEKIQFGMLKTSLSFERASKV